MDPLFPDYTYIPWKAEYIRNRKKIAGCLICALISGSDSDLICHEIGRNELFFVILNLFPYNPGHLLISPLKHYEKYTELSKEEKFGLAKMIDNALQVLPKVCQTEDFNVGFNQGRASGGSIRHLHIHIVPRYRTELNFLEVIGGTRALIESLEQTRDRLLPYAAELCKI
ncbi:MAG: HIT domain-containing protein [Candidatus Hodarchaeota archaeon]